MKTKTQFTNRILSLVLSIMMVVSMLPTSALSVFAADTTYPYAVVDTEAGTVTIDGTLGGNTTATEEDITALVEQLKVYVDNGITTIIVTGSNPALIEVGSFIMPAVSEALYRLTHKDSTSSYCGTIDLILPDVTTIVDDEFNNTYALNSITLPKVTTVGDGAFYATVYLQTLTFGSVITFVKEESSGPFHMDGYEVGGCDLVLNCEQLQAEEKYKPNLETNVWFIGDWSGEYEWKSITLTHTEGTAATCTAKAICSVCGDSYGELGTHTAEPTYAINTEDSTQHDVTYPCCDATITEAHNYKSGTPAGACVCGAVCPHSNFDSATGNCTDCETPLAIAKVEIGGNTTYYQTADELRTAVDSYSADQSI